MQMSHYFVGENDSLSYEQMRLLYKLKSRPKWAIRRALADVDCPRYLYKYFSLDSEIPDSVRNVRSVVVDSRLWLSRPSEFNDPFDFRADVRLSDDPVERRRFFEKSVKKVVRTKVAKRKRSAELVRKAQSKFLDRPDFLNDTFLSVRDGHGVCCFSTDPKSILMWAHYGRAHSGLCLQFEVARDVEVFSLARPVSYDENFPALQWPRDREAVVEKVIFKKFKVWDYENERRIVVSHQDERLLPFNDAALTAVICGHRMADATFAVLRELMQERRKEGRREMRILRSVPNKDRYGMKIFRLASVAG